MSFKYIGDLPSGFEYKIVKVGEHIRVIGIAHDKSPIGFLLKDDQLHEIKIDVSGQVNEYMETVDNRFIGQ